MAEPNIEVVFINDTQSEPHEHVVPHERQVVGAVIDLWKEDASTESICVAKLHALVKQKHPNWEVSEKRVRNLLKQYGLLATGDQTQYTYAEDITSLPMPHLTLPDGVEMVMTTDRGKGFFAKRMIMKGTVIWEEKPLFLVPLLSHYALIMSGKACTHCGKLGKSASKAGELVLRGLDCPICPEIWCSHKCKNLDQKFHSALKHGNKATSKIIDVYSFNLLTEYCTKEQWNALYAIAMIYAYIILDKSGVKGEHFNAMARVSQKTRYKALNSSAGAFDSMQGGALFIEEQQEQLWNEGYKYFTKAFPKAAEKVSLDEFLHMMGTYNINNIDLSIFLLQSHLNHNCSPNCEVETAIQKYEGLKVVAARDIEAGEELTTSYVNPFHTVQLRQRELRVNWGFLCECQKCKDDQVTQHRRKSSAAAKSKEKAEIQNMFKGSTDASEGELEIPFDFNGERRKSVRFDEKVIKVNQTS